MKHNDAIEANTAALNQLAGTLRPCDYAGFTPDEDEPVAPPARSADYERGYRDGYETALLKLAIAMLERASIDATILREQLERGPAA